MFKRSLILFSIPATGVGAPSVYLVVGKYKVDLDSVSVREAWNWDRKNKPISHEEGRKRINLIRDYTYKLHHGDGYGTAWILDYELPDKYFYPTKFFFATNIHVAMKISYDTTNPYNQEIWSNVNVSGEDNSTYLSRETFVGQGGDYNMKWDEWEDKDKSPKGWGIRKWIPAGGETQYDYYKLVEKPKLVYMAINYAGENKFGVDNYFTDFAVIEVDFKDPVYAKTFTRNFYNKYHYRHGYKKESAVDIFARPLLERKTNRQLYNESPGIFAAGYPWNGLKFKSVGTYNFNKKQAPKLTFPENNEFETIRNESGEELIGHSVAKLNHPKLKDEKRYELKGLSLVLDYDPMKSGSSGSMVTDEEGGLLGVISREFKNKSFVDAIRSKRIVNNDGVEVIPEYDLIEGVDSKSKSYRGSIANYLLKKGRRTYLSEMRGWNVNSY